MLSSNWAAHAQFSPASACAAQLLSCMCPVYSRAGVNWSCTAESLDCACPACILRSKFGTYSPAAGLHVLSLPLGQGELGMHSPVTGPACPVCSDWGKLGPAGLLPPVQGLVLERPSSQGTADWHLASDLGLWTPALLSVV